MFKKLMLLTAIYVVATSVTHSQGFKQLYSFGRPNTVGTSVIPDGNNFIVSGLVTDSFAQNAQVLWARIDSIGNVIEFKPFGISGININSFFPTFIKDRSGDYLNTGYLDFAPVWWTAFLVKFNSSGDTLFFRKYEDSLVSYFMNYDLIQHSDGNYYIAGCIVKGNDHGNASFLKIDNSGNLLVKKTYGTSWSEKGSSIMELPNKNILIGAHRSNDAIRQTFQREWSKTWLIEVDTGGNMVRQWIDTNDSTYWPTKMMLLADSNFVYTTPYLGYQAQDSTSDGAYLSCYFAKRDLNFNKIWELRWGVPDWAAFPTSFDTTANGDFIVVNSKPHLGTDYQVHKGICVVSKINASGQMLWQREYFPLDTTYTICNPNDVKVLPNGDIVVWAEAGAMAPGILSPSQQAWMLKIDSNGCLTSGCTTGWREQDMFSDAINVFPNLTHNNFLIEIENPKIQGGNLEIYDITGRKLLETANNYARQIIVNMSSWSNGIYLWRYTKENQAVQSGKVIKE